MVLKAGIVRRVGEGGVDFDVVSKTLAKRRSHGMSR